MAYYMTRNLALTQAANTFNTAVLDGPDTLNAIVVPAGVKKIVGLLVSIGASVVAVASTGGDILLRLTGNGLSDGQQDLTIGSIREDTTSTGGTHVSPSNPIDVDIDVVPGNQINVALAFTGVDPGTPEVAVTLIMA